MHSRKIASLISAVMLCMLFVLPATAAPAVILDDQQLSFDIPPAVENGRTLVPMRAIFEAMGATVTWDQNTQSATAIKGNKVVILPLNSTAPTVNGTPVKIDVAAKVVNQRILAPLRFVGETFGGTVGWDQGTQTITISSSRQKGKIPRGIEVPVTRVVDGDTIEVSMDGKTEKVRLIGIDTPETVHPTKGEEPYGKEASNFTKTQLTGKTVELEFDVEERDKYGRILAYVWLGDKLFNETLVAEGYAQIATYPPNIKYVDKFRAAQETAREQNRGLWGVNEQVVPQEPTATSGEFVGSLKSDKYHYPSCRHAEKIITANQVWFKDAADAKAHGYQPCGVCKP